MAAAGVVTMLAGCGGSQTNRVDPAATARYIDGVVGRQTRFHPTDTRCPSGIPATLGRRFTCHFTGPEGPYTVYLRILRVNGRRVDYRLVSQPSSRPAPKLPAG